MKAGDLSAAIHTYPTLAQINRRAADQRLKEGLTPTSKAWIKRIFRPAGCLKLTHAPKADSPRRRAAWG